MKVQVSLQVLLMLLLISFMGALGCLQEQCQKAQGPAADLTEVRKGVLGFLFCRDGSGSYSIILEAVVASIITQTVGPWAHHCCV